eukprot:g716.t1
MGNFVTFTKGHDFRVIVIGLDNAGKSSILSHYTRVTKRYVLNTSWRYNNLAEPRCKTVILPTSGLAMHELKVELERWRTIDFSGQGRYRKMWTDYYSSSNGVCFVVDASNLLRLGKVEEEFELFLQNPHIEEKKPPVLIFVNKGDHATDTGGKAASLSRITTLLRVNDRQGQQFKVVESNGLTGEGIQKGFSWLNKAMRKERQARRNTHS